MTHAEICPVCKGTGKYEEKLCHGCGGKGWIEIGKDDNQYFPFVPYYPSPYCPGLPYTIIYSDSCNIK